MEHVKNWNQHKVTQKRFERIKAIPLQIGQALRVTEG